MALEMFQNPEEEQPQVPATEAVPTEAPKAPTKESLYSTDALQRLHKQQIAYNQHLQRMIDSFQSRQKRLTYDPQMLALAEGLLSDTPFFGVAAGKGFKGYREAGEQMEKNRLEDLKIQNELLGEQLKGTQGEVALERQLTGDKLFRDIFARGQKERGATDLNTEYKIDKFINDAQDGSVTITPQDIALVASYDEKRGALLEKLYDNQQKAKEIEQKEYGTVKRFLPVLNESTDSLTVRQARVLDRLVAQNAPDEKFVEFYQREGILAKPKKVAGEPIGETKTTAIDELEGPAAKAKRLEIEKLTGVEKNKQKIAIQQKDIEASTEDARVAGDLAISGKQMFDIADNEATKGMFGKLAKKGYDKLFLKALESPVKIGNTSIGIGNIEDLVIMAGGDENEIAAAKQFKKPASEAELAFTRIYLSKQGQVTEGERVIVRNIIPGIGDPAQVVKAKAELLLARAQFDQQKADLFNQFIKANPLGTMNDFMTDPSYKRLYKAYAEHTAEIANDYMPGSVKEAIPTKGKKSTTGRQPGPLEQSILGQSE